MSTITKYYKNDEYNVLTDNGFKHFDGLQVTVSNKVYMIVTNQGHILATEDHEFYYTKQDKKPIKDFEVNECFYSLYGKVAIIKLVKLNLSMKVYDLINVEDGNSFLISANGIKVSNCAYIDEMAFIDNDVDFFTSTFPVISSGSDSKVIITSTPNGMNLFYKLYTDSQNGDNDFVSYKVHWSEHPKRDQEWYESTVRNIGEPKFKIEYESLSKETVVTIKHSEDIEEIEIGDLYDRL